jgi:hypothetical protein
VGSRRQDEEKGYFFEDGDLEFDQESCEEGLAQEFSAVRKGPQVPASARSASNPGSSRA